MISDVIKICEDFIEEVLNNEYWFCQLNKNKDYDLLLLTGTFVEETKDKFSDVDIFLICKNEIQTKYSLKPVYIFNYKKNIFEISLLSTEKLFNDQLNKENIHWWHHTHVIKSYNKKAENALFKASSLSDKELLDRLWTNFVYFEINTIDIEKQIKRKEPFSVRLLFNENIKIVVDSELICKKEFPSWKQSGKALQRINEKLYKQILQSQNPKSNEELKKLMVY